MTRPMFGLGLAIISLLASGKSANASMSANAVIISARTLGFLQKPLTGTVRVGIVFAADAPQSAQDAAQLQAIIGAGLKVGGLNLTSVLVPIAGVDKASVDLFFLTAGLGASAAQAGDAARVKQIPCVTLDIPQVQAGYCAIGIQADPRVEILVNRDVAARSGAVFAGAFKMLLTEF